MQDIITKVPSWILRWGITLFFGILLMAFGISVLVRYPDTIKVALKLESVNNAKTVLANGQGIIQKVLIKQGETIKTGQPLATVETTAGIATLTSPADGKVSFIAIVQPGSSLKAGQEVFAIHPQNEHFFGLMQIPQTSINKIKTGQQVLIKLRNFPVEDYGQLKGRISYIADEPGKEGFFAVKVDLDNAALKKQVALKSWMIGDAEIITENVSLQARVYKSILKGLN
jgi:multidrug resistance efflux pump